MAASGSRTAQAADQPSSHFEEARRGSLIEQIAIARRERAHVEGVLSNLELELDTIESSRASRFRQRPTTSPLGRVDEDLATSEGLAPARATPPAALESQRFDPWAVEPEEATTAAVVTPTAEALFSVFKRAIEGFLEASENSFQDVPAANLAAGP